MAVLIDYHETRKVDIHTSKIILSDIEKIVKKVESDIGIPYSNSSASGDTNLTVNPILKTDELIAYPITYEIPRGDIEMPNDGYALFVRDPKGLFLMDKNDTKKSLEKLSD